MALIGPFPTEAEAIAECSSSTDSSDSTGSDDTGSDDTDRIWCGCHDAPDNLTMTVSGPCSFANGSYTLTAHPSGGYQYANGSANPGVAQAGLGAGCGYSVTVRCPGTAGFSYFIGFLSITSCNPISATGGVQHQGRGGCCQGDDITVTITE